MPIVSELLFYNKFMFDFPRLVLPTDGGKDLLQSVVSQLNFVPNTVYR